MTTFNEIGIQENILKGINELGYTAPTAVQEQIIPIVLNRQADVVGLAQTGTGKTAAFGIPLIQLTETRLKQTQSLVLCPTRELCVQVARDLGDIARYVSGLSVVAVYGGASIEGQIRALRGGAQIIVATPGRLHDLIRRHVVDISAIRLVVLDEADEMLQMGFQDELNAILANTPADKNTLLFSATMPKGVAAIASKYMKDPVEITIGQRNAGSENVRHVYYMVQARDRFMALRRIVDSNPDIYAIVFCRTRQETNEVAEQLIQSGYGADALHGDLSQGQRDHVMNKFRNKSLQLLVATDVAARGLDVSDLTHVINYNLPDEIAGYTHRSGRTGRAGKSGISIAIIHMREKYKIREIEKILKRTFEAGRIPSGHEICQSQLLRLASTVKNVAVAHEQLNPFFPAISEQLASLDREELIKRFFSIEFNRFLEVYRNAPELNVPEREKVQESRQKKEGKPQKEGKSPRHASGEKFTRLVINVGKKDGVHPARLIGHINDNTDVPRIKIGKIEVMNYSSILEAESRFTAQVLKSFEQLMINGKNVSIEVAGAEGAKRPKPIHASERKSHGQPRIPAGKKLKGKKASKRNPRETVHPFVLLHQ
ncbi:MAG: DEAD/DEAH box helicase [Deltaproteobacteria bacterium]|nr:DEAD/DEAH box helicase [Deltaproteobacteria bacterium]